MRRIVTITAAGLALAASLSACGGGEPEPPPKPAGPTKLTKAELIARAQNSVVQVLTEDAFGNRGAGSGLIIDKEERLVVTNDHVTADAVTLSGRFGRGKGKTTARVIGSSPCDDLALVQLDRLPDTAIALPLASPGSVETGEELAAYGFVPQRTDSLKANLTVTFGIASAVGVRATGLGLEIPNHENTVQTDAPVNPGNSGGPLVDQFGQVVGVITIGSSELEGIAHAIDVEVVREALPELKEGKTGTGLHVEPIRTYDVPAMLYDWYGSEGLTADDARMLGDLVHKENGMLVTSVEPGSPADRAGLDTGDLITHMNNKVVGSATELCEVEGSADVLKVEGWRIFRGWDSFSDEFTRRLQVRQ
jgi:S1-C subfamily serine protease